jgi:hypothetical protein
MTLASNLESSTEALPWSHSHQFLMSPPKFARFLAESLMPPSGTPDDENGHDNGLWVVFHGAGGAAGLEAELHWCS